MKSVVYHTLRTVSGNAYVKCGLWNHITLILCPCHFALNMISHTLLLIHVQFDILLLGIQSDDSIMAWQPRWQDPEGLDAIKTIIKKLIPNWMNPFWTERALGMLTVRIFSQFSFHFPIQFLIENESKNESKIGLFMKMGPYGPFSWKSQFSFHFWVPFLLLDFILRFKFNPADFSLPPPHHSRYPTYPVGIRCCYPCQRAQHHQESPPPPDHQLPLQATFRRGAGRPGMMGRNSRHDDNDRDGETVTTRRRRRRQWRWCTQDDSMVLFCIGAGFFFVLITILLALPSCICVGLVLLCIVPLNT